MVGPGGWRAGEVCMAPKFLTQKQVQETGFAVGAGPRCGNITASLSCLGLRKMTLEWGSLSRPQRGEGDLVSRFRACPHWPPHPAARGNTFNPKKQVVTVTGLPPGISFPPSGRSRSSTG